MKQTLTIIITIVLMGLLFWGFQIYFLHEKKEALDTNHEQQNSVSYKGIVTEVDMSQIPVDGPARITFTENGNTHMISVSSMGRNLCAAKDRVADPYTVAIGDMIAVAGELEGDTIIPCRDVKHYFHVRSEYKNTAFGFSFIYEKSPQGFTVQEILKDQDAGKDFAFGVILTEQSEFGIPNDIPHEEPPIIGMKVFKNTQKESVSVWAMNHSKELNSTTILGGIDEIEVGGVNAVHFIADGLYATETYVVAHGDFVYVITGAYIQDDSYIHHAFASVVESFSFISQESE